MPTSVEAGFNDFLARLALTQIQSKTANEKITSIRNFFANDFQMAEPVISVGSYRRDTIIRPQRDVDLLAVLSYDAYKNPYDNKSRDFLYMVRNALNNHYGSTEVSSKLLAVRVDFSDMVVDVVPCFRRKGGGYLMPNGKNGWLATNPPFHTDLIANADAAKANKLRPIVRLMKEWNLLNGNHLTSFHVELLVERIWRRDGAIGSPSATLASTLKVMPSWVRTTFDDPWSEGGEKVDSYLSSAERQLAIRLLEEDARNSEMAETYRLNGRVQDAFERWKVVFRQAFPSYG